MSRILLADDSPHAQRMGELILREEGFEVVSVTDGQTALVRLADVDPDVVFADVSLPTRNGYEICQAVRADPRYCHTRVVLTAGAMEPIDESEAKRVQADGKLRKPFEATAMLEMVKQFVEAALQSRQEPEKPQAAEPPAPMEDSAKTLVEGRAPAEEAASPSTDPEPLVDVAAPEPVVASENPSPEPTAEIAAPEAVAVESPASEPVVVETIVTNESLLIADGIDAAGPEAAVEDEIPLLKPPHWEIDPQAVRAAVTLALEAALPVLIDEVTQRVMTVLAEQEGRLKAAAAGD